MPVSAVRPHYVPRRKYPFESMEVGEMFFVPYRKQNTLAAHCSAVSKALNRRFQTRLIYMVDVNGTWMPTKKDTEGAVVGVGVWRTR